MFQGFRTLLAQTLTTDNVIVWTASLRQITSFTTDSIILHFMNGFLKKSKTIDSKKCGYFVDTVFDKLSVLCLTNFNGLTIESDKLKSVDQVLHIPQKISLGENHYLQSLLTITYECVIRDKISLLPWWLHVYKLPVVLNTKMNPLIIWQMKFPCLPSLYKDYCQEMERLINIENILANKQRIRLEMDSWESGLFNILIT